MFSRRIYIKCDSFFRWKFKLVLLTNFERSISYRRCPKFFIREFYEEAICEFCAEVTNRDQNYVIMGLYKKKFMPKTINISVPKRHCDSCKHGSYFHSLSLVFFPQKIVPEKKFVWISSFKVFSKVFLFRSSMLFSWGLCVLLSGTFSR